jgi:Ca2+-binding EF-hand superfamily protein
MKEMTSLKREEMLVFCFLLIDQNRDGLVTIEDLMNLLGIRSKNNDYNPLITSDVLKIYAYVDRMKQKGDPVTDTCDR